jgi:hypothetical protein
MNRPTSNQPRIEFAPGFESVLRDIRSWFDLSRYDVTKNFTTKDWYSNLHFRSAARFVMFPRRHLPDEFEAAHSKALAEYVWSVIEENPILSDPSSPIPVKLASGSREIKVHEKTRLLTQPSVRPTQCGDLVEFIEQYRDSFTTDESLDLVQDPVVADAESAFFLTAIDQISSGYQQNHALLTIDLRASNDQLDADFRAWLNLARKTYRESPRLQ